MVKHLLIKFLKYFEYNVQYILSIYWFYNKNNKIIP